MKISIGISVELYALRHYTHTQILYYFVFNPIGKQYLDWYKNEVHVYEIDEIPFLWLCKYYICHNFQLFSTIYNSIQTQTTCSPIICNNIKPYPCLIYYHVKNYAVWLLLSCMWLNMVRYSMYLVAYWLVSLYIAPFCLTLLVMVVKGGI